MIEAMVLLDHAATNRSVDLLTLEDAQDRLAVERR
jgi:hypothetical protein